MNTELESNHDSTEAASTVTIIRWLIRESMGVALVGVILFLSAGTMNWLMGWILVAVTFAWVFTTALSFFDACVAFLSFSMKIRCSLGNPLSSERRCREGRVRMKSSIDICCNSSRVKPR